ncbi:MAG: hypothetical protein R6U28_05045 [Cyclonatronaceae bacterium]
MQRLLFCKAFGLPDPGSGGLSIHHYLTGLFFLASLLLAGPAAAQPASPFSFTGSLGLSYDAYRFSESNYATFRPRHPDNLARFTADATLSAGRHFSMPFSVHITTGQNTYHLPSPPDEGLVEYIQNPRNNVHFYPSYRWVHGFLGAQTPDYSDLTTGDIAMFGTGLELDPGHFLFTVNYGKSQVGVEYDPFSNIAGAYEQRIFASRIGYGPEDGTRFVLHFVKASDDETSIAAASPGIRPAEGITFSPLLQLRLSSSLYFSTELAGSAYTFDLLGPENPYDNEVLDFMERILTINASTNTDWSNVTSLEWRGETFTLGGEVRFVGPGFQSAGYRVMERDLIDYKINSRLQLLNNRLMIDGSFGLRTNNLYDTTLDRTNRTLLNLNVFAQASESFSINTNYANFGFRNNVTLDTLRIEMVHHTVSVAPSYRIRSDAHTHVISGTVSYSHFDEFNLFTGRFQNTVSLSISSNYQLLFNDSPLSLGGMAMVLNNNTPTTDIRIINTGINARYRLLDDRLAPSLLLSHSHVTREGFSADNRIRLNLKAGYRITDYADLNISWNASNYRYGSSRPDATLLENRFQVSLQTRF